MLQLNKRLLEIDYQYRNASRTNINVGARYRHLLNPDKNYALEFCMKYHKIVAKNKQKRSFLSLSTSYVFLEETAKRITIQQYINTIK